MSDGGCRITSAGLCMLLAALSDACSCSGRAAGTARPTVRVWAQDPSSFRAALNTQASPTWRDTASPQGPKSPIGGVPPVLVSWPRRHLASSTCAPFPLSPLFASHAHPLPPHPPPPPPRPAFLRVPRDAPGAGERLIHTGIGAPAGEESRRCAISSAP